MYHIYLYISYLILDVEVQNVAAEALGVSSEALIALQLCGASSGNAFCLSNIIAATRRKRHWNRVEVFFFFFRNKL